MFRISKLEDTKNEKVDIQLFTMNQCGYENGKKVRDESFKTLSFCIYDDNYSFSFELKCRLEKLLELPMSETVDFSDYLFSGETFFNAGESNPTEPKFHITINRYVGNSFLIFISFYTDYYIGDDNDYSGVIEFTFDLDDYLDKEKKDD